MFGRKTKRIKELENLCNTWERLYRAAESENHAMKQELKQAKQRDLAHAAAAKRFFQERKKVPLKVEAIIRNEEPVEYIKSSMAKKLAEALVENFVEFDIEDSKQEDMQPCKVLTGHLMILGKNEMAAED